VPTSTGLPITWQCCKRHDWKHEKVICPFCRAEKAEQEWDEARPVLEAARDQESAANELVRSVKTKALDVVIEAGKIIHARTCAVTEERIREYDAARAAGGEKKR